MTISHEWQVSYEEQNVIYQGNTKQVIQFIQTNERSLLHKRNKTLTMFPFT